MKNEENNMTDPEELEDMASCDPLTKPTMRPPGGSSQGYWDCDTSKKTWVWVDSIA